jgi:membrane protein YqaA with SNARE-associated domain
MKVEPDGKREVAEAVLIAAFSALVSGLVNWGLDRAKAKWTEREKERKPKDA